MVVKNPEPRCSLFLATARVARILLPLTGKAFVPRKVNFIEEAIAFFILVKQIKIKTEVALNFMMRYGDTASST